MTYRDDHDAALARADALEAELARERARSQASRTAAFAAEERARKLEAQLAARQPQPPSAAAPAPARPQRSSGVMAGLGVALVAVVSMARACGDMRHHSYTPVAPSYHVRTPPPVSVGQ
jgi:hypothetical protein